MAIRLNTDAQAIAPGAMPSVIDFTITGLARIETDISASHPNGQTLIGFATGAGDRALYLVWEGLADDNIMYVGSFSPGGDTSVAFASRPAVGQDFEFYLRCSGTGAGLLQAGWRPKGGTTWVQASTTLRADVNAAGIFLGLAGYGVASSGAWADASVWNAKCWTRPLNDTQVAAETTSVDIEDTTEILWHYLFTNNTDDTDRSGNGNDATFTGTLGNTSGGVPYFISSESAGVATVNGSLRGIGTLSGTSNGVANVQGSIRALASLAGTSAGTSTVSGRLRGIGNLSGSISGTSLVTGALNQPPNAISGSAAGTSTVSGRLRGKGNIAGQVSFSISVTGTLKGIGRIRGSASGTSTATATATQPGALSGSISGLAQVSGSLRATGYLRGSIQGTSTVSGRLVPPAGTEDTIDGQSSHTINTPYGSVMLYHNGRRRFFTISVE